jgi:hypothetical protein
VSDAPSTVGEKDSAAALEQTIARAGVDGVRYPHQHDAPRRRGGRAQRPPDRVNGMDVIPFEGGLVKRKDVYSDSVSILRQVGLLD